MKRYLALFNKLRLRERLGALFIAALVVYFIMDVTALGPAQKQQKALKAELAKVEADLVAIRGDMTVVKAQLERDPFAKDRAQLDAYKKVIDDVNAFVSSVDSNPRQVGDVLRQLIAGTPGVTLVSLKTLPPQAVSDAKGGGKSAARAIYRRGIEVTIKANYLALIPYLEKMQHLPQKILWSEATLEASKYPDAQLRILVYTLSAEPDSSIG